MKNRTYLLNTILAIVVGIAMLAIMLVHTFLPNIIIPKLSIPNLMLLSLIALVLDHCFAKGADRCYFCIALFSAITFALLPWLAGYTPDDQILKTAISGCAVFTAASWLFSTICDRLSSGPASKAALVISAIGLYLAAQCFANILI